MELTGQLWFTFGSPAVWTFYRFVRFAADSGHKVALEWMPIPGSDEDLAMSVYLSLDDPTSRGRFLHAMLGLVHLDGRPVTDASAVRDAIAAAEVDVADVAVDVRALEGVTTVAGDISVGEAPSLYRYGPPMTVRLTPAALLGDPSDTLRAILEVSEADAIWELRKP
jgi:hypothetical protein